MGQRARIRVVALATLLVAVASVPRAHSQVPESLPLSIQGHRLAEDGGARLGPGAFAGVLADTAWATGGALGVAIAPHSRLRVDMDFRWDGGGGTGRESSLSSGTVMANALVDIPTGSTLRPYLGVGAGVAYAETAGHGPGVGADPWDGDMGAAYQAVAGVDHRLAEGVRASLGYRFLATAPLGAEEGRTTRRGGALDHTVMVGLRYRFDPPTRPLMAAPEPATRAPEAYFVFFDPGMAALTVEAAATIGAALAEVGREGKAVIRVTDPLGRSARALDDPDLDARRALAIANALEARGLPRAAIEVMGLGAAWISHRTGDARRITVVFE